MTSRNALLLVALLGLFATGNLLADQIPYSITTTGAFGGSHPDLAFTPRTTPVTGTTVEGSATAIALGSFTVSYPHSTEITTTCRSTSWSRSLFPRASQPGTARASMRT